MTIDELNKLLSEKKQDGIVKATIDEHGTTIFRGSENEYRMILSSVGHWQNIITISNDFFELVAPYVDTPLSEREPEKKYNIIFFKDIDDNNQFLTMVEKDDDDMIIRTNEDCDNSDKSDPDYQFTESEINKIIKKRPEFKNTIEAAMFEVGKF
ncbi:hypothetical protein [Apilactobacillus micheneri]|uniref:hypothetical protein n=1 Tax=Apilactobacillus micheneri TaxID=1899430 RepID=UPI001129B653|nr:hypothetical protein [Apilactobacillus micheneri]TPR40428.1 hypothetical protein DY119_01690 [Apilactobacillus micheneri]